MSAGYPYPFVPPLPEFEERKTNERSNGQTVGNTSGSTERKLTPEQLDAQERQDTLLNTQSMVAEQEGKHRQLEADARADLAKQQADQAAAVEKQRNAALDLSQKAIDDHRRRIQETQSRLDATPSPKFFQDGETWHNALRAAGAGLAGVGDALVTGASLRAGHAPPSIDTVSQIIDRDLNGQREHIARLKDNVLMAHTGLADANQARQQMLADVELRASTAYDRLAKIGAARLAALGQKAPDLETNKEILALIGKREEARQKALEPLYVTVEKHLSTQNTTGNKDETATTNRDNTAENAKKAKADENIVRDENGVPIGHVASGRGGAQAFATRDADYARAIDQLKALQKDVTENDTRVFTPEAMRRRAALYHNAIIGVATVSPLGQTNEAMEQEAGSVGASGAGKGVIVGANPDAIAHKIEEMETQRERYRKETLTPIQAAPSPATQPPPFVPGPPAGAPPAAPAASSPAPQALPPPVAPAPHSAAPKPDNLSAKPADPHHTQAQIKSIQQLLKSPEAKKPENRAKVKALIARMRDLQEAQ